MISTPDFQVTLPASIQRLGRMRSGAIVEDLGSRMGGGSRIGEDLGSRIGGGSRIGEDLGDRRPSLREAQRSSSIVENILEISSEMTPGEETGVSRRRTTVVAEL